MGLLRDSFALALAAFDGAHAGYALVDRNDVLCWHSNSLLRHLGRRPSDQLTGFHVAMLWRGSDRVDFAGFLHDLWRGDAADQTVVVRAQGDAGRYVQIKGQVMPDGEGQEFLLLEVEPWHLLQRVEPSGIGISAARGSDAVMILEPRGPLEQAQVVAANSAARRRLGEDAPGKTLDCFDTMLLPPAWRAEAEAAFVLGQPFSALYTLPDDGTRLSLVHWDLWPAHRQNGRVTHWIDRRRFSCATPSGNTEDIRWLHLASDALKATDVGVWHWDLTSQQFAFSQRLLDQLGYDRDGALHDDGFFDGLHHPEDLVLLRQAIDAAVLDGTPFRTTIRLRSAAGRYQWIALQGQVIRDEDGRPVRIFGTENDVTEETLLRERLLRAERIAKIGHWALTLDPPAMTWSPECYRLHGQDPDSFQPTARAMTALFHPEDRVLLQNALRRTLREGRPNCGDHDRFRARILRADGTARHCEFTAIIERDGDGQIRGLVGTIQDISAAVHAERNLVQAQKMEVVGQLAGGVAHDFNNLLSVVMGNLELAREAGDAGERNQLLQEALEAARKGSALTRNLLGFSRRNDHEPERIDLNTVLVEVERLLRRTLPQSIKLDIRSDADLPVVQADRNGFENAVLNLAINARDAMEGTGLLVIRSHSVRLSEADRMGGQDELPPGDYAVVCLRDSGRGLSAAQLAQVFDPFFTTKPEGQGTGLGLPMVVGFARASGGAVRMSSTPGKGTEVRIYLPAAEDDTAPMQVAQAPGITTDLFTGRVMLVEDDPGVNRVLTLRLERMGLTVTPVFTGDEAETIFHTHGPFDLILTDVMMPGALQGPDLAATLRLDLPDLPVVFMSGYPRETALEGTAARDEDISLLKPVGRDELTDALAQYLPTGGSR